MTINDATLVRNGGFDIYKGGINRDTQLAMVSELRDVVATAPLFSPQTKSGKSMSVRMTSAGKYGWFSDRSGYRYIARHPQGMPWPEIPPTVISVWKTLVSTVRTPDCCLINYYDKEARMGLHRDNDEKDFSWPVLSISLGDPARFRMGGTSRSDPTGSMLLESGDVVIFGGKARLCWHGIDRILFGRSDLLQGGGRLNLTLRVVD